MHRYITLISILFISNCCFSQSKLSQNELNDFQRKALKKVKDFEKLIIDIAAFENTSKQTTINVTNELFEPEANIEVSRKVNDVETRRTYPKLVYFNNLAKLNRKYNAITIKFITDTIRIDKLRQRVDKNGDIYYTGNVRFTQCFCASSGIRISGDIESRNFSNDCSAYGDCTKKKVKIKVVRELTIMGERWVLYLSDITVEETTTFK